MAMTSRVSRFVLTSHLTFSVGWLGAVAVFLMLAVVGLTSRDHQLARAAYLAMELSAWLVIVPFCLASLLTGLVQALGTAWGLFKHYWIVVKLVLTLAATVLLMLHLQPIGYIAGVAAETSFTGSVLPRLRVQLVADACAALLLLLIVTTISVYKPWGRIPYRLAGNSSPNGWHQHKATAVRESIGFYVLIGLISLVVLFIIVHLLGGGMGHH